MSNTLLYITCVLIWGSTWLAIVYQLGVVPAEVSIFYRYVLASGVLFTWCLYRKLPLKYNMAQHFKFALLGLLLFSLNYIFAYIGQQYIYSALMAIMFSTLLWMNIINARLFFKQRAGSRVLLGALFGVLGVIAMFWPAIESLTFRDRTVIGALFGIAGTFVASLGNMVSMSSQKAQLPIVQSNAWGMLYGAVFTGVIAVVLGKPFVFDTSPAYVISLVYLSIFGSVIAFGAYLTLLGRIGAHKAGYATILFPVVALLLSVLFEDFVLTPTIMAGILLVLVGNYFVMQREH